MKLEPCSELLGLEGKGYKRFPAGGASLVLMVPYNLMKETEKGLS
jgi:hypothetical protein